MRPSEHEQIQETEQQETAPPTPVEEPTVESLAAQLERERQRTDELHNRWARAAADYQNLKRRTEDERGEISKLATARVVLVVLPVLDDLDRAVRSLDARLAGLTWAQGIVQIYQKLSYMMEQLGVREIEAEGETFDPNLHEAVSRAPGEEGKIVAVVQRGFTIDGRVIRPSMVIVGDGAPAES